VALSRSFWCARNCLIGFSLWQDDIGKKEKKAESDRHTQEQISNEGNIKYMQGQLDSIGMMIGELGEGRSDPGLTKLADAIGRMSRVSPKTGEGFSEPRRLSETRRIQLATLLQRGAGHRVAIYIPSPASERDRQERADFAKDLQAAFERAKWKVIVRHSEQADLSDYTGILFVYDKGNPPESWPDFTLLKKAFDSADINYSVTGLDAIDIYTGGVTTADPVVYVGEK
jgi:hypothetical protein